MIRFWWCCRIIVLLCLAVSPTFSWAGKIKRFVIMVPIYQELYSENIGLLLKSLYQQDLSGLDFEQVDLVLAVNHTTSAKDEVKKENYETVEFLKRLSAGQVPAVRPEHRVLSAVAKLPINQKLKIHVIDWTNPGFRERNIGILRDEMFKKIYNEIPSSQKEQTVMTLMDGDTRVPQSYVKNLVSAFESDDIKFVLQKMVYVDQPDSIERVYQRKITTDFGNAAWEFQVAMDGGMPGGGSPRVAVRADVLYAVGGIPHETVGEDCKLIEKLKSRYLKSGLYLPFSVMTNYRAREGSYDGKIYLDNLNKPIEFGSYERKAVSMLNDTVEGWKRNKPTLYSFYRESYERYLIDYKRSVTRLKSLISLMIDERQTGVVTFVPSVEFPALIGNGWFSQKITDLMNVHGANDAAIMKALTDQFPYYLNEEPLPESLSVFKLWAGLDTLLVSRLMSSKTSLPILNAYQLTHPKFFAQIDQPDWTKARQLRDELVDNWKKKLDIVKVRATPNEKGMYLCGGNNCTKHYHVKEPDFRNIEFDFGGIEAILNALKVGLKSKAGVDEAAILMPLYRVLDDAAQLGMPGLNDQLTRMRDFINSAHAGADEVGQLDWNKIRKVRDEVASRWQETIKTAKSRSEPNKQGKFQCKNCKDYHCEKPDLRGLSLQESDLKSVMSLMKTDVLSIAGPDERAILMPLYQMIKEAQQLNVDVPAGKMQQLQSYLNLVTPPTVEECNRLFLEQRKEKARY